MFIFGSNKPDREKHILEITVKAIFQHNHSLFVRSCKRVDSEKMVLLSQILFYVVLFNCVKAVEKQAFSKLRPKKKITVTLSGRKPFVILNSNGAPKGLDVTIMENFAKRLNFGIDYSLVNGSQNYIPADRSPFSVFPDQFSLR